MPIVQISRLQVRRGLLSQLPNALAEGEIGMTIDTGEVFIGNPNFPPIANRATFPYQNIQLLTEFSLQSLASTSLSYVYKYQDPDDAAYPGPASERATSSLTVQRLLQERLDEVVSVKSYGATGNGTDDDTLAIKNAISDLYDPLVDRYRVLYFPAGTYRISSPLPLYPRSSWLGDGIEKSIISLDPNFSFEGSLDPNVDSLPTTPSILDVYTITSSSGDFGGNLDFTVDPGDQIYYTGVTGELWKLVTSAFKAVVETANSDGNVGGNINDFTDDELVTNALPEDIIVRGMTIERNTVGDVVHLNRASRCIFEDVSFKGGFTPQTDTTMTHGPIASSTYYDSTRHGICVRIDSLSDLVASVLGTSDFAFINCEFRNNTYGFYATDDLENVTVMNSIFEDLFKGVSLGEGCIPSFQDDTGELSVPSPYVSTDDFGPSNFKVMNSRFNDIMDSCFSVFSTNTGNISENNIYQNYGQGTPETPITPTAPAVFFYADFGLNRYTNGNISRGDTFDYTGTDLPTDTNLRTYNVSSRNVIDNPQDHMHLKQGYELGESFIHLPMEPVNNRLEAEQLDFPTGIILNTNIQKATSVIVDYSIDRGQGRRVGQIHIVTDGLDIDWWESYSDIGDDILIDFAVANTASQKFRVKYTDIATGTDVNYQTDAYLRWTARYWNAGFDDEGYTTAIDDEIDINGISGSQDWGLISDTPAITFGDYGNVADAVTDSSVYGFMN